METPPSVEDTLACIATLYHNPNPEDKNRANQWLQSLQNSVYAWKVSDEILHRKPDLESCYIAAQTMRNKIQTRFHEVPQDSRTSLRDSLIEHLLNVDEQTSSAILTQLALALADLILLMSEWNSAINETIQRLKGAKPWVLLEVLVVLPEEVSSRLLRLGANRRNEVIEELKQNAIQVDDFLKACVSQNAQSYKLNAFKALTSWLQIGAINLEAIDKNEVMHEAFKTLSNLGESPNVYEAAADCVIALLIRLEDHDKTPNMSALEFNIFNAVRRLDDPYHLCVAHEDLDKASNLCRVFTELAETFLVKMVNLDPRTPHFAITILENLLTCCGHPDYEIPDITFNFWYRLSEELYQKNDDDLNNIFRPFIERLINALCRHCQMEPDLDGLLEEGEDFGEFRNRVTELIKDVVFVVGSANVFKHMFAFLQPTNVVVSWETSEAALFIMSAVARNLFPEENENVPQVLDVVLNSTGQHLAVRHTSVKLVGELGDWINHHPDYLQSILNWLLYGLQEPKLASQAANSLTNICSQCQRQMTQHFEPLVHILNSLDSFKLKPNAAQGLVKGASLLINNMSHDRVLYSMKTLTDLQLGPISILLDKANQNGNAKVVRQTTSDPVLYLDRLATIFRHVQLDLQPGEPHPAAALAINDVWPVVSRTCSIFPQDSRIMERTCRTLRFVIRCIGIQSAPLVEGLVKLLVSLYIVHPHSCFLYLGSILVDEYAHLSGCVAGLLEMLRAFLPPTFSLLNISNNNDFLLSLRNHPDTVDDFFRLNARFLQRAALAYLQSDFLPSVIECALMSLNLDHKDANGSVMKFIFDLLHAGRSKEEREDFDLRAAIIHKIRVEYGSRVVDGLVKAAIFYLPTYTYQDIGDILLELMLLDRASVCHWLESSLKGLPEDKVTHSQLVKFHKAVTTSEEGQQVTDSIREFCRLWR